MNVLNTFIQDSLTAETDEQLATKYGGKTATPKQAEAIQALNIALTRWQNREPLANHSALDADVEKAAAAVRKLQLKEVSEHLIQSFGFKPQAQLLEEDAARLDQLEKLNQDECELFAKDQEYRDGLQAKITELQAELDSVTTELNSWTMPEGLMSSEENAEWQDLTAWRRFREITPVGDNPTDQEFVAYYEQLNKDRRLSPVRDWLKRNAGKYKAALREAKISEVMTEQSCSRQEAIEHIEWINSSDYRRMQQEAVREANTGKVIPQEVLNRGRQEKAQHDFLQGPAGAQLRTAQR